MARRAGKQMGRSGALNESGRDMTLATVLLADGIFERVDEWTPLDEIVSVEALAVEPCEAAVVIVPIEDYLRMRAVMERGGGARERALMDLAAHQHAEAGWTVLPPGALAGLIAKARHDTLTALLRYVWFNAGNLWEAMRALLAVTHKWRPEFVKGMSGSQIAKMLGVGRQAFNKQSIKMVQDFLERWGVSPMQTPGSKGVLHQEKKRRQMMGRRHRAEDYEPENEAEPLPKFTREQLDEMHRQAERRRLAKLAGVKPEEIQLEKTCWSPIGHQGDDARRRPRQTAGKQQ